MSDLVSMVRLLLEEAEKVRDLWTLGEYEEVRKVLRRLKTMVTEHDSGQEPKG